MKKITKNIIATALAAMTAVSAASVSFSASAATDKIRLIVKNETYSVSEGAAWEGVLYDKTVDISEGKDALSTVTAALNADNVQLTVNDTQWGSYIAAVNGIAENDAAQYSGWMGVQNDWVVNNNLAYIFLRDGDTFELTYSVKIGSDIGADWNNPTTALKALSVDGLAFNEEFTPSNTDYTVTIGDETKNVFVLPTAENKNYQVRTYINEYVPESVGYRKTDEIEVKAGDTLYIGVGNAAWPGSYPEETVYKVHVMAEDAQLGDVNFDGKVDITDATLIQKASIDLVSFSELQNKLAEYNGDGRVSVLDTTAIQRMIASR